MPAISKRSFKKWLPQYTYTVSYPIFIGNRYRILGLLVSYPIFLSNQEMFSLIAQTVIVSINELTPDTYIIMWSCPGNMPNRAVLHH